MGMIKYDDVPSYLATQPPENRKLLEQLRETLFQLVPDAEDSMSYGMPVIRYKGKNLVAYAGFKNHCSFFPMSAEIVEAFAEELKDYKTSKGTIQFTAEKPLPAQLVRKIIAIRLTELE